jgi:putative membrane protein
MVLCIAQFEADPLPANLLTAWSFPVGPFIGLAVATLVYIRGWSAAHKSRPTELPSWRAACFIAGILSLWIALASPIDALDDYLLASHMIQHFILMSVAPPLIALGAPTVPFLRGLPRFIIRILSRPVFQARWLRSTFHVVTHPAFAWLAMNIAYLGWHVPMMFELTFRSERIHDLEHVTFFLTSLVFWWVVLAPWPSRMPWQRWTMIPYLLSADILNTVLSGVLCFSGRVLYPTYAVAERVSSLTPLQDQVAAGAEMWVLNSAVFLVPAVLIVMQLLSPRALADQATLRRDIKRHPRVPA